MEPQKLVESWVFHQAISDNMLGLGVKQMNDEEKKLNKAAKWEMEEDKNNC